MAHTQHLKVKPQVLAEAGVSALGEKLVVSNTINVQGDSKPFMGSEGDTITKRVRGTLPVRSYKPRNDRSEQIRTDQYEEQTVQVKIEHDRPYSAIRLTEEQKMWDFEQWGDLIDIQQESIAEHCEFQVLNYIINAPYERSIAVDLSAAAVKGLTERNQDPFYNLAVDARSSMKKMRTPGNSFTAIVGAELADEISKSNILVRDSGLGSSALAEQYLGKVGGVNFVRVDYLPDDVGYVYERDSVVLYNAVADVPQSVPFGATTSKDGWNMRWLMDYETAYLSDRSVFDLFTGYGYTKDYLKMIDGNGITHTSDEDFFVRGVKIGIKGGGSGVVDFKPGDGKSGQAGASADSALAKIWNNKWATAKPLPEGEPFHLLTDEIKAEAASAPDTP